MKKAVRGTVMTSILVLAACSGDSATDIATGKSPTASRFELTNLAGPLHGNGGPRFLDTSLVTVVAKLAGPPVALVQEAAGRKLTPSEKQRVRTQHLLSQAALRPQIEAVGGTVVGAFQHAFNGLKVQIPRNRIEALRNVPGVVELKPVNLYQRQHVVSVPRIHAPDVWAGVFGLRGEGIKVAVIDTGIDYTHANFGGPGTPAAYTTAQATSTMPADPLLFGPSAPKVKGGTDLAGDDYTGSNLPVPDSNPLDCGGHGSHTAGTVGGFGVLADGTTYAGPYDPSIYAANTFNIGPGVAPKADLYAVRVFGCSGSTDLVAEALDWAVANDMDVVSMSLGSGYGSSNDVSAEASENAVKAGIVVVAASGNAGDFRYITGSPASSASTISVAASDRAASYAAADLALPDVAGSGTQTIRAQDANGVALTSPSLQVKVLRNPDGTVSLGCSPAEYVGVTGMLVVTARGTCARVARAIFGQQAGAAAVAMINNAAGLPPYEGPITSNPDTGVAYNVTIPFLGVSGTASDPASDGSALVRRDGAMVALTAASIKSGFASFTSGGPRNGDSLLKPDITAPGVNIISTLMGSGTQGVAFSGTSMATPHVAGVAALVRQAHPALTPYQIKAAILDSGNPDDIANYVAHLGGSGFVNAASAARTSVIAYADTAAVAINYGMVEFQNDFTQAKTVHLRNYGTTAATFDISNAVPQGSQHSITWDKTTVTVPAKGSATITATLTIPAAYCGNSDDFRDVAGLLVFTPQKGSNYGIALRIAYYAVPRVSSAITTGVAGKLHGTPAVGSAVVDNIGSQIAASADFFAWGLNKPSSSLGEIDLRAAGVQKSGSQLVFAVNTYKSWSTPATVQFNVLVDTTGDGNPEYVVYNGVDSAGRQIAIVQNVATGVQTAKYYAITATDASTLLLPVDIADLGLGTATPRFWYKVSSYELYGVGSDQLAAWAPFNALHPAISTGQFVKVDPNKKATVDLWADPAEWVSTPPLGLMIVSIDNKNGAGEAQLAKVTF